MKSIFIVPIFLLASIHSFAQTIEVGSSYTSGNAVFYKNLPGFGLGFNYNFKNQYLFFRHAFSFKNSSYMDLENDEVVGMGYVLYKTNGKLFANSLRLGFGQNILNSKYCRISLGVYGSLNYFRFNETSNNMGFNIDTIWYNDKIKYNKSVNNKPGIGGLIDFEIKNVLFENTSVFTRISGDIIQYDGLKIHGYPFLTPRITDLSYQLGIKINLKNKKSRSDNNLSN